MSFYQQHLFLCINERSNNKDCCAKRGSKRLLDYLKAAMKPLDKEKQTLRISSAGCLGRCQQGPVLVIYPESTWYHYATKQDMDEIIEKHLCHRQIVQRLLLK